MVVLFFRAAVLDVDVADQLDLGAAPTGQQFTCANDVAPHRQRTQVEQGGDLSDREPAREQAPNLQLTTGQAAGVFRGGYE